MSKTLVFLDVTMSEFPFNRLSPPPVHFAGDPRRTSPVIAVPRVESLASVPLQRRAGVSKSATAYDINPSPAIRYLVETSRTIH
jgi:hypothetical protein